MNAETIISFLKFMNENPDMKHNRKAYKKTVDKIGDDMFIIRKQRLFKAIQQQKKDLMDCFDIYEKFVKENGEDIFKEDTENAVNKLVEAFGLTKEEPNDTDN